MIGGIAALAAILLLGIAAMHIANTKRTASPVAAVPPPEPVTPTPSKPSADSQKLPYDTKEQVKQTEPQKLAVVEERDLEKSVNEFESKAARAQQEARNGANYAADATARRKKRLIIVTRSAAAKGAVGAADWAKFAKKAAKEAAEAAQTARSLITEAGNRASPKAKASANNADSAANVAASFVQKAEASSEEAGKFVDEANEAAEKAKAIADSLRQLDGKEIDFPPCEKGGVTAIVGRISKLGVNDYCLAPVGAKDLFPAGYSIEAAKPQKSGKRLQWDWNLVMPPERGVSARSAENILSFFIKDDNLMVRWAENARPHYKHSDQLRNCLWVVSARH